MPRQLGENAAIVTFWFVTAADPQSIIRSEPRADRGFGRKYLAHLNPSWPITPIGQFALNRSVPASANEFYIAGFPGVTILQTALEDVTSLHRLDPRIINSVPASDTYVFAVNEETTLGGFAHIQGGVVKRSFIAGAERVYEDIGLPGGFETPYWAGKMGERSGPLSLPFNPIDLVAEAQRAWLGFDVETSPDVNVVAFAVDGRPEPKIASHRPRVNSLNDITQDAAEKLGFRESADYDDYEHHETPDRVVSPQASLTVKKVAHSVQSLGKTLFKAGKQAGSTIAERLRHTDRVDNRTQRTRDTTSTHKNEERESGSDDDLYSGE